jgi:hypothetical protein
MTKQNGDIYDPEYLRQGSPTNTTFAETIRRLDATVATIAIGATGVEYDVAVPLNYGDLVTNITFVVGGTAAASPTAGYACLRDPDGALLAQTADFADTARAANTAYTVALATPQLISTPGIYYVGIAFAASTVPTLQGKTVGNAVVAGALGLSAAVLARTHGSSLTDTAPATTATPTTVANLAYMVCT